VQQYALGIVIGAVIVVGYIIFAPIF
jgi:hypothetical protein